MKKLSITSISAVLLGMGIFSSPAAWAQTTTTLTFKQNGNAICDTVQLVEDTSGFIRGRQIADNCPNGDYILTGRRNNAQGYVLYTGASGAGMTQLLFNAGGSVDALQLNGTTTPTPSAAWAGVTWGVGTVGVSPVAAPTTTPAATPATPVVTPTPVSTRYALVPNSAGGNYDITECVQDTQTGLIWEGNTTSGWRASSYTNYGSDYGTVAQINASTNSIGYANAVNAAGLCGFNSGWRMPTKDELLTLVKTGVGSPTIDTTWLPNPPSHVWSGSPDAYDASKAWGVGFYNGGSYDSYNRYSDRLGVWLVRGGQ
jgi:hypothetical protein